MQMGGIIGVRSAGQLPHFQRFRTALSLLEHRYVLDAIRAPSADQAAKAMEQLLSNTRKFLENELADPAVRDATARADALLGLAHRARGSRAAVRSGPGADLWRAWPAPSTCRCRHGSSPSRSEVLSSTGS
jgi:hypothetical protein